MSNLTDRLGGARTSLAIKAPVRVATTAPITLSGFQTIDGVTLADGDDNLRVLVKEQSDAATNGIYVAQSGHWQRARDFDGNGDVVKGTRVVVAGGTSAYGIYEVTTADPIVIGTSSITFVGDFTNDLAGPNHPIVDVASATTTDIGAASSDRVRITGTTTITSLGTAENTLRFVHFSGALTLTHNATSLILPGATNITTAAGDSAIFSSDADGNWRCLVYQSAAGGINISGLTDETSVNDEADSVPFYDASAGLNRRALIKNLGFTQSGTGALLRDLQGKLRDSLSVLDFIPKAEHAAIRARTTTTNVATYIQAAIDAVDASGGGVVYFPAGLYVSGALTLRDRVVCMGDGSQATELKLANGTNATFWRTENFSTLTGTGAWLWSAGLPTYCGWVGMRINGNKANNTSSAGANIYAKGLILDDLIVYDCAGVGLNSEAGDVAGQTDWYDYPEGHTGTVWIRNCDSHGWQMRGPHDIHIYQLVINECGGDGLLIERSAGVYSGSPDIGFCHIYANDGAGIRANTSFRGGFLISESNHQEGIVLTGTAGQVQIGQIQLYNNCRTSGSFQMVDNSSAFNVLVSHMLVKRPGRAGAGYVQINGDYTTLSDLHIYGDGASDTGIGLSVASGANYTRVQGTIRLLSGAGAVGFKSNDGGGHQHCHFQLTLQDCTNLWYHGSGGSYNSYEIHGFASAGDVALHASSTTPFANGSDRGYFVGIEDGATRFYYGATGLSNGSAAAPSLFQGADIDTGIYFPTTAELGVTVAGTGRAKFAAGAFTPVTSDGYAIGSTLLMWSDAFFASGAVINFNAGNYTITHSAGSLAFSGTVDLGNTGLRLRDTNASHWLTISPGSDLTADRTLTIATGDAARTVTLQTDFTVTSAGAALMDDADASAQRTTLGLGTIATQAASSVAITGGSITGITDLAVADGGTGASSAQAACKNIGAVWLAGSTGVTYTTPADTSEHTAYTVSIPASAIGSNGVVYVEYGLNCTASTNSKTARVKLAGTTVRTVIVNAIGNTGFNDDFKIHNMNSESSQKVFVGATPLGAHGSSYGTSAVDTSATLDLTITLQKASSGETLELVNASVRVAYSA